MNVYCCCCPVGLVLGFYMDDGAFTYNIDTRSAQIFLVHVFGLVTDSDVILDCKGAILAVLLRLSSVHILCYVHLLILSWTNLTNNDLAILLRIRILGSDHPSDG